MPDWPLQLGL